MIVSEDEMSHSGFLLPSLLHLLKDVAAPIRQWTVLDALVRADDRIGPSIHPVNES
jgi:hypothetical protein